MNGKQEMVRRVKTQEAEIAGTRTKNGRGKNTQEFFHWLFEVAGSKSGRAPFTLAG